MVCVRWPCPIVRFSFTVHESNIQKWLHHTQNRLFTCNSDTLFDFRSFVCCPENVPHGGTMSGAGGSFAMNYSLVDHMDNSPPYDHFIAIGCWPFYKFAYICILFDQLWWCLECNFGSKTVFFADEIYHWFCHYPDTMCGKGKTVKRTSKVLQDPRSKRCSGSQISKVLITSKSQYSFAL